MSQRTKVRAVLRPAAVVARLWRLLRRPPVGTVELGDLARLDPISDIWGTDRGRPIDRFYIERFLEEHAGDIRGRTLEVGMDRYTRAYGGDRVSHSEVLDVAERLPGITMVGDLETGSGLEEVCFDCVILTQTLQFIFDPGAALVTTERILAPGGTLLLTVPGISKLSRHDMDRYRCQWSFSSVVVRRLLDRAFPGAEIEVEAHGNVLIAVAFLHGLGVQELEERELLHRDPQYEVLITARVRKVTS